MKIINRAIKLCGETMDVKGVHQTSVLEVDVNGNVLVLTGTTIPTAATAGYAKGCKFIDTDAATGDTCVYENIGTVSSCNFVPVIAGIEGVLATGSVVAKTGNATIVSSEFGGIITNTGASGALTHTLPAASTVQGKSIKFTVLAAQIVNISPASADGIFLNGSGVDNKDLILAGTVGTSATIYSNGTNYICTFHTSGVTKEA